MKRSLSKAVLFGLCAVAHISASAEPLSFDAARQRLMDNSDQLAGSRANQASKVLQAEGIRALGGPSVSVSVASFAYNTSLSVNLDGVNQKLSQIGQILPAPVQGLLAASGLASLPANYTLNEKGTITNGSLTAVWPIYMGGLADATRGFVSAQANEALSDTAKTEHELITLLVQRYFGAQMALKAAQLRHTAQADIAQHDATAEKMLRAGLISQLERLQAQVAFEESRRQTVKADDAAELAMSALNHTLKAQDGILPQTPLFVATGPLEPLAYFVDQAMRHHPGLSKVAAKKAQAEQLHAGQEALRKPQLFAFGQREITSGDANWMAGIGARWNLYDSINHDALAASAQKMIDQADSAEALARNDIGLLVEKNWRAVEQARHQFLAAQPGVFLASEILRLRGAALREGTGTALELMDAQTNQAKVMTERAQIAYDYALALASLLESCGLSEQFGAYIARADTTVE